MSKKKKKPQGDPVKLSELAAEKGKLALRLGEHKIEIEGVEFRVVPLSSAVYAFVRDSATRMVEDQLTNAAGEVLLDEEGNPRIVQYPKQDEHTKNRLLAAFGIVGWGEGLVARFADETEAAIEYKSQETMIHGKGYQRINDEVLDKLTPLLPVLAVQVTALTTLTAPEKKSCSSGGGSASTTSSAEPTIAQA